MYKKVMIRVRKADHHIIRSLLKAHDDGMTVRQLASLTGAIRQNVYETVSRMPDVYIDRWLPPARGNRMIPVYCAAEIPEDCPKPEREDGKRIRAQAH